MFATNNPTNVYFCKVKKIHGELLKAKSSEPLKLDKLDKKGTLLVQYSTVKYNTGQYSTVQYNSVCNPRPSLVLMLCTSMRKTDFFPVTC